MSEWKQKRLGSLCDITTGDKDVNQGSSFGLYPFFTCSKDISKSNSFSFDTEALLIAGNGDVGILHYYKGKFEAYQRTYVLYNFNVSIEYLKYYISAFLRINLLNEQFGTTIKFIKLKHLTEFNIYLPIDETEQTHIAKIISTLDKAITSTQQLIAKYQRIKTGLLDDLLTCGIDENGNLRNEKTHHFKESKLGRIPVEWDVDELSKLAAISSGITLGKRYEGPDTVELPYLRVANVQDGFLDLTEVTIIRLPKSQVEKNTLQVGDVLMNEGGDFDKLGRGTIWQGQIPVCLHQNHVFKVRAKRNLLLPEFLEMVSQSQYGKKFFILASKQSTNLASINSTQLKAFPIPLPGLKEQRSIVNCFSSLNNNLKTEASKLNKLQSLKTGLMQDLLSGKVKVK